MKLKFGSVCSGIEAASVAWEPLGWRASWFAEIEAFPSAVLAYRFPTTLNLGDMTKIAEMVRMGFVEDPDVLVGGTPCQAFSVAGSRQSLDDERGQLSLSFITLANTIDEQRIGNGKDESIVVWENVPGVLNTKDNAFGCFLGELSGAGCELQPPGKKWTNSGGVFGPQRTVAWRVLDAQYFGVAQRRRRVFVVASARKGFNPCEVLFESEGLRRDTPPSRSAGQKTTRNTASGFAESSFAQFRPTSQDSATLKRSGGVLGGGSETLVIDHPTYSIIGNHIGRKPENGGNGVEPGVEISPCLTKTDHHAVVYSFDSLASKNQGGGAVNQIVNTIPLNSMTMLGRPSDDLKPRMGLGVGSETDPQNTLTKNHHHAVYHQSIVRRLTPVECERLQGFPDNWTQVPYRNKSIEDCPDGPRYAACGNSMAVPVMRWIAQRIEKHLNEISHLNN